MERFLEKASYTAIVSWLTVLHIKDRHALFQSCYNLLCPGGKFYAADLCAISDLSVRERQILRDDVHCHDLATMAQLATELEGAGFRD